MDGSFQMNHLHFLTGIGCHSILSFHISSSVGMNRAANTNLGAKNRTNTIKIDQILYKTNMRDKPCS